ncbi:putative xyloglucan endotransglucosylase/hydrolase protein 30 [Carex littledalei]|uniref:Xyloglucan endotransglucosylase/hydrolase n=1 Tax=Carex littledalei TaxID=544730 RepID=A0A833VUQ8_9POAL|nr:putative xyloglucan endotransglucosylase/hydrolase protein 30 [Carex littledalei]
MSNFLLGVVMAVLAAATTGAASYADTPQTISFDEGYSHLFGGGNLVKSPDGSSVRLKLDRYSGSGFISTDSYQHGFFSASIKLPRGYTAGVVVAFYLSNGDAYEHNHDELDFEFLGERKGKEWRVQTNIYGNGSTSRGREERYLLPFDPSEEPHNYSILWTSNNIIFYIDDIPIREVIRNEEMGGDFPSKPMYVYATIWDGSAWATEGGKFKVNYKYAPFVSEFSDFVLRGCRVNNIRQAPSIEDCAESEVELMTEEYAIMTSKKRNAMRQFRNRYMTYTVCYDTVRYSTTFPECDNIISEKEKFWEWGESKVVMPRRRSKRKVRAGVNTVNTGLRNQAEI